MRSELSEKTAVALLLTAPLIVRGGTSAIRPLDPSEYNNLVRQLDKHRRELTDLLAPNWQHELRECGITAELDRLESLLKRGFALSLALEEWRSRTIWVISSEDSEYPDRIKERLGNDAPPILYGCGGNKELLNTGGLAVFGSRNVDGGLISYTESIGRLATEANATIVSGGGARKVDQTSMRGVLDAGGSSIGVLHSGLAKAVLRRDYREALMYDRLVLVSPYDPSTQFNAEYAMARNKLIYALADAALVVSTDYGKGSTLAQSEYPRRAQETPCGERVHTEGLTSRQEKGGSDKTLFDWIKTLFDKTLQILHKFWRWVHRLFGA